MRKTISLIGNCQTVALCKFIRELPEKHNAKWLCFEKDWIGWASSTKAFSNQVEHNLFCKNECLDFLKQSDVIIYQPYKPMCEMVNKYKKENAQIITLSPIFVNNLDYIKEKENKYSTNIKVSEIIIKNSNKKLYIKDDNHPTTFLTLEILEDIAEIAGIKFFDKETYEKLLLTQYPQIKDGEDRYLL